MTEPEDYLHADLIDATTGISEPHFVYESDDEGRLFAIEFDASGEVLSRYLVKVRLEEL